MLLTTAVVSWLAVAAAVGPSVAPIEAPEPRPTEIYDVRLVVDVPIILVAATSGLVRIVYEDDLARIRCPCDPAELNPLDRHFVNGHSHAASIAADVTVYALMGALPLADLTDLGLHRAFAEDFVVYLETLTMDTFVQNSVNFVVSRPRPMTYANDPFSLTHGEGYLSFYAGHVATAFAAMSAASYTIRRRYGERVWPWIATFVVGGSVAVERVASGHHFPTDVPTAAVMGTTFGIVIPWLHAQSRTAGVSFALAPTVVGADASPGLGLGGRF
jgi:membrane-associated phospholipid phosphatase